MTFATFFFRIIVLYFFKRTGEITSGREKYFDLRSCEDEMKRIWESAWGDIIEKLASLQIGLQKWAGTIREK